MKDFNIAQGIILILLITLVFFGLGRVDKFLKERAIDACIKTASYSSEVGSESGKNMVVEPIREWYTFCMKEKGYK